MKAGQMIESKYLKKEDLDGGEVIVTVSKIGQGNVAMEDQPEELKWMIRFKEFKKPMVLNSTNIQLLTKALGTDETEEWLGREVILYVDDNVSFGGKLVGGIRIKSAKPVAAPKRVGATATAGGFDQMDDDIPFAPIGRGISGHAI